MMGAFLIKLTQLEKVESTGKIFSSGNLKINFHFPLSKLEILHVFCTTSTFVFGECYLQLSLSADEFQLNLKNAYIQN